MRKDGRRSGSSVRCGGGCNSVDCGRQRTVEWVYGRGLQHRRVVNGKGEDGLRGAVGGDSAGGRGGLYVNSRRMVQLERVAEANRKAAAAHHFGGDGGRGSILLLWLLFLRRGIGEGNVGADGRALSDGALQRRFVNRWSRGGAVAVGDLLCRPHAADLPHRDAGPHAVGDQVGFIRGRGRDGHIRKIIGGVFVFACGQRDALRGVGAPYRRAEAADEDKVTVVHHRTILSFLLLISISIAIIFRKAIFDIRRAPFDNPRNASAIL